MVGVRVAVAAATAVLFDVGVDVTVDAGLAVAVDVGVLIGG